MIVKPLLFVLLSTVLTLADSVHKDIQKNGNQKNIPTFDVTVRVSQELFDRIDKILKAYEERNEADYTKDLNKRPKISKTEQQLFNNIINTLNETLDGSKKIFVQALSYLEEKKIRSLDVNGKADIDVNIKANLTLNLENKWDKFEEKVDNLINKAANAIVRIKDKGPAIVDAAVTAFKNIKQKASKLIQDAKETYKQVKGEIVGAFKKIKDVILGKKENDKEINKDISISSPTDY